MTAPTNLHRNLNHKTTTQLHLPVVNFQSGSQIFMAILDTMFAKLERVMVKASLQHGQLNSFLKTQAVSIMSIWFATFYRQADTSDDGHSRDVDSSSSSRKSVPPPKRRKRGKFDDTNSFKREHSSKEEDGDYFDKGLFISLYSTYRKKNLFSNWCIHVFTDMKEPQASDSSISVTSVIDAEDRGSISTRNFPSESDSE